MPREWLVAEKLGKKKIPLIKIETLWMITFFTFVYGYHSIPKFKRLTTVLQEQILYLMVVFLITDKSEFAICKERRYLLNIKFSIPKKQD